MIQEEKRVGVFMKVYRNEPTMHEAINSVLGQTYQNIRYYILVNEATKPVVEEYAKRDNRIEILEGTPQDGFRTLATYVAKENAYVTVIDADDWYDKQYVEELLKVAILEDVDMVACGNYYFNSEGNIVGERKQETVLWETEETIVYFPYIYGHFRTIWGKLIASHVLLECDFNSLPESKQYGGYGGDTLLMFHLFPYTKKLAVINKSLYYYRMSEISTSYMLTEGRLESDEVLFYYVENVLKTIGDVTDRQRRFLLWIYGKALLDTIRLLLNTVLSKEEQVKKLLYILQKPLTEELIFRESRGLLDIPELGENMNYTNEIYRVLFSDITVCNSSPQIAEQYLLLVEIVYPKLSGVLSLEDFQLLLKSKRLLDTFIAGKYSQLLEMFLALFGILNDREKKHCLSFMRRLTSDSLLKNTLQDVEFVKNYLDIIKLISGKQYEKVYSLFKNYFSEEQLPYMAENLAEVWSNLAASLENAAEFILSRQVKVEVLIRLEKVEQAVTEYEELEQLGIDDENMRYLKNCLDA